jgi:hypothetical protein
VCVCVCVRARECVYMFGESAKRVQMASVQMSAHPQLAGIPGITALLIAVPGATLLRSGNFVNESRLWKGKRMGVFMVSWAFASALPLAFLKAGTLALFERPLVLVLLCRLEVLVLPVRPVRTPPV